MRFDEFALFLLDPLFVRKSYFSKFYMVLKPVFDVDSGW